MSEAHSRKERLNTLDQMLENEAPKPWAEVLKEASLEWGITEKTLLEYLEVLGYEREMAEDDVMVVPA